MWLQLSPKGEERERMNASVVVVFAVVAGIGAYAETPVLQVVKVCVEPGSAMPALVTQAEARATQMFADVGVKIEWLSSRRDCKVPAEGTIRVRLTADTPDSLFPGALAYSRPYDGVHVEVFYGRIVKTVE